MDSSMKDVTGGEGGQKVVKQGFGLILMGGHRRCSAVRHLQTVAGHKWIKFSPMYHYVHRLERQIH